MTNSYRVSDGKQKKAKPNLVTNLAKVMTGRHKPAPLRSIKRTEITDTQLKRRYHTIQKYRSSTPSNI